MTRRHYNSAPGASFDAPGLCGRLACGLLPLLAWFGVQPLAEFRLTDTVWADGAWHTLWTGHLMHYGIEHFVWDALMFVSFALLLWEEERWRLWLWLLVAAPVISLAVFAVHPSLSEYRGLSALDTMLFVRYFLGSLIVLGGWQRVCFAALPLLGLAAKIAFELSAGTTFFVSEMGSGVVPLPAAHITGAALGLIWFAWRQFTLAIIPPGESTGRIVS